MERYIDADNFRKTMIKRFGCIPCLTDYSEASRYDIPLDDALNLAPTADVVPRAEVEKIFAEIEKKIKALLTLHLEELNKEYIKDTPLYDRHSGILFALQCMEDFIAELKKKYTEGERK